jgi:hypothetical protein
MAKQTKFSCVLLPFASQKKRESANTPETHFCHFVPKIRMILKKSILCLKNGYPFHLHSNMVDAFIPKNALLRDTWKEHGTIPPFSYSFDEWTILRTQVGPILIGGIETKWGSSEHDTTPAVYDASS